MQVDLRQPMFKELEQRFAMTVCLINPRWDEDPNPQQFQIIEHTKINRSKPCAIHGTDSNSCPNILHVRSVGSNHCGAADAKPHCGLIFGIKNLTWFGRYIAFLVWTPFVSPNFFAASENQSSIAWMSWRLRADQQRAASAYSRSLIRNLSVQAWSDLLVIRGRSQTPDSRLYKYYNYLIIQCNQVSPVEWIGGVIDGCNAPTVTTQWHNFSFYIF